MHLSDCEDFDIMCCCSDYALHYKCLYYEAVFGNVNNGMRIIALLERGITVTLFRRDLNQWNALQISVIKGEGVIRGKYSEEILFLQLFNLQQQFVMILN